MIMFRTLSIALFALAGTACQAQELTTAPAAPTAEEAAACTARGGTMARGGRAEPFVCVTPTPDAGKACTTATDCSGFCMADTRTCSPTTPIFGCLPFLDADGHPSTICID